MKKDYLITPDINALMVTPSLLMTIGLNDHNIDELLRNTDLNNLNNNDLFVNESKPVETHVEIQETQPLSKNKLANEMEVDNSEKSTSLVILTDLKPIDPSLIFQSQQDNPEIDENSSSLSYQELITVTNHTVNDNLITSQSNSPDSSTSFLSYPSPNSSNYSYNVAISYEPVVEENSNCLVPMTPSSSRSNGSVRKPYKRNARTISLSSSDSSFSLPAVHQSQRPNQKEKKYSPSVQKRVDELLANGQEPAVFGNRVVVKYSDEYYELRERNDKAVESSRKKKDDEKREKELELERILQENEQLKNKVNELTHEVKFLRELFGANKNAQ